MSTSLKAIQKSVCAQVKYKISSPFYSEPGSGARDGGGQLQSGDPGVVGAAAARETISVHADQEGQRRVAAHTAPRHPDQQRRRLPEHVPREVHQGLQRRQGDDEGRQQEGDGAGGPRGSGEGLLKVWWSLRFESLESFG